MKVVDPAIPTEEWTFTVESGSTVDTIRKRVAVVGD